MTFEICPPTGATSVRDRSVWLHEVTYDGYRLRLERDGNPVRLITQGGYNWTGCRGLSKPRRRHEGRETPILHLARRLIYRSVVPPHAGEGEATNR
jgi:hypothetical protein